MYVHVCVYIHACVCVYMYVCMCVDFGYIFIGEFN